jgi:hypothetical protein
MKRSGIRDDPTITSATVLSDPAQNWFRFPDKTGCA